MTKFLDGPAAGVTLSLRRAPIMLRVVRNRISKQWDALDQLEDEPKQTEDVYLYMMHGEATRMHLCIRGKNKAAGGWYAMAEYKFVMMQPDESHLRTAAAWDAWCDRNKHELLREYELQKGGQQE